MDPGHHFGIQAQILAQAIGGLQLLEALEDPDLAVPPEAFAFPAPPTFPIAAAGMQDLKGAAENTLRPRKKLAA